MSWIDLITWAFIILNWQMNMVNLASGFITQAEFAAAAGDMEAIFTHLRRARRTRRFAWPLARLVPAFRERLYPPRVEAKW